MTSISRNATTSKYGQQQLTTESTTRFLLTATSATNYSDLNYFYFRCAVLVNGFVDTLANAFVLFSLVTSKEIKKRAMNYLVLTSAIDQVRQYCRS